MEIVFDAQEQEMIDLQVFYNAMDPEAAIFMNHYDLARATGQSAEAWKRFIMHPKVSTWINQEMQLFTDYQLRQMLRNATDNEKSVGAAQMINSLSKNLSEGKPKEGPIIIYTHVPLTSQQCNATTVQHIELDENVIANIPREWTHPDEDA